MNKYGQVEQMEWMEQNGKHAIDRTKQNKWHRPWEETDFCRQRAQ